MDTEQKKLQHQLPLPLTNVQVSDTTMLKAAMLLVKKYCLINAPPPTPSVKTIKQAQK